jgi:DNA-binding transcriptional MerR regulator
MSGSENDRPAYSVSKLASLAGVSVRTLHLYDEIGLLKPQVRTESGYRKYGEQELLRLQQILLYRELDFALHDIARILDDPEFDVVHALVQHRQALENRKERLSDLLRTIDNTISNLKNGMELTHDELYSGFRKEDVETFRSEIKNKYGNSTMEKSESYLKNLGKQGFEQLKEESKTIATQLLGKVKDDPTSDAVQSLIAKHYEIIRKFWGTHGERDPQQEAYAGLGDLYVSDERYTTFAGKPNVQYAAFMQKAMKHFASKL